MKLNKKQIITIAVILIVLVVVLGIGIIMLKNKNLGNEENDTTTKSNKISNEKYYIHIQTNDIPGCTYTFKMNDDGSFYIKNARFSSATGKVSTIELNSTLNNEELKNVKKILNYIKENSEIEPKEGYYLYFDSNSGNNESVPIEIYEYLTRCMSALEKIAKNDEIWASSTNSSYDKEYDSDNDGKVTAKEFGDAYLENIIKSISK